MWIFFCFLGSLFINVLGRVLCFVLSFLGRENFEVFRSCVCYFFVVCLRFLFGGGRIDYLFKKMCLFEVVFLRFFCECLGKLLWARVRWGQGGEGQVVKRELRGWSIFRKNLLFFVWCVYGYVRFLGIWWLIYEFFWYLILV